MEQSTRVPQVELIFDDFKAHTLILTALDLATAIAPQRKWLICTLYHQGRNPVTFYSINTILSEIIRICVYFYQKIIFKPQAVVYFKVYPTLHVSSVNNTFEFTLMGFWDPVFSDKHASVFITEARSFNLKLLNLGVIF